MHLHTYIWFLGIWNYLYAFFEVLISVKLCTMRPNCPISLLRAWSIRCSLKTTWILSWWLLLQQVLAHSILHGSSRNWMHERCTFSYSSVNFANFVDLFLQTVVLAELKAALNLHSITATSSNWSRSNDLVLHLLQILVCPFTEAYLGAELC